MGHWLKGEFMLPIKTILHPTDFSERSDFAFRLACALARDYGARLIVLNVIEPVTAVSAEGKELISLELDQRAAEAKLFERHLQEPSLRLEHRQVRGSADEEIVRFAQRTDADLIVMGMHGRTGLARLLMGSVAEQVVRKAPCAVLTAKAPSAAVQSSAMVPIRTILYPTDFSENSKCAFPLACALARDHKARLIVLHVYPLPVAHGEIVARRQDNGAYYKELSRALHGVKPVDPAIDVHYELLEGDAATEILSAAQEFNCDLIVLGTHGRTGLRRLLMGSVAEKVVRNATCPVLTAKGAPTLQAAKEPAAHAAVHL
jgi:nucleotide-binding universal stress UspA family protein